MHIRLREYQAQSVEDIRQSFRNGSKAPLYVLPTGGGKGTILTYIAFQAGKIGNKVCIYIHRDHLIWQLSKDLKNWGVPHGIIAPGMPELPNMPVQIASIWTIKRRPKWWRKFNLHIVDEAHHATASTWENVLGSVPGHILGVTATPARLDGRGLGHIFDDMIIGPSMADLVSMGYLARPRTFRPSQPQMKGVKKSGGDYNRGQAEQVMDQKSVTGDAVEHYRKVMQGAPTLVFCTTNRHAEHVREQYSAAGFRAARMDQETPMGERRQMLHDLAQGRINVLTSCEVISEGTDVPQCYGSQLLRPTDSLVLYLQQCLDSETDVLTQRGWIGHQDIQYDDYVAGWQSADGSIQWCAVQDIVKRPLAAGERMYAISSPHLDIRVTGGHDMLVRGNSPTAKNWQKQRADDVAGRSSMFMIPVSGVQDADDAPLSDDEVRFLGWFLSDGTHNPTNNAITISQTSSKHSQLSSIRRVLRGCGFKYGEHTVHRSGEYAGYDPLIQFTISYGVPRGRDRHLRGWSALDPWIDKTLPPVYEQLSARQFSILLDALNEGDGVKSDVSWTRRTMAITAGDNVVLAERLQSLCVRRGFRANLSMQQLSTRPSAQPQAVLYIQPKQTASIAGQNVADGDFNGRAYQRSRFVEVDADPGETVWCVQNELGSLIIRRNGKVAIVGNCGRSMRPKPNGEDAIILDHAGNSHRHGLPEADRKWSLHKGVEETSEGGTGIRTCQSCFAVMPAAQKHCPVCGAEKEASQQRTMPRQRAGELLEAEGIQVGPRQDPATMPLQQLTKQAKSLDQLRAIEQVRGYRPGWAENFEKGRQKTKKRINLEKNRDAGYWRFSGGVKPW